MCLLKNKIPYKIKSDGIVSFRCDCKERSTNKGFLKCISTDLTEDLHKPTDFNAESLKLSTNLLEFNTIRKYISLASATAI